jgi:hypothetical protein
MTWNSWKRALAWFFDPHQFWLMRIGRFIMFLVFFGMLCTASYYLMQIIIIANSWIKP